ncbi:hypothetical protein [Rufibacter latericius]|uniref:Uncharacterized protein n=1 Tax=Rufibacter latericius TaxID=2487040 RepID=A0A3M9MCP8_9BACT|nr:hypothetical protein [Rufibacter latericius]RNI22603.1 hypothetical protein EFB08_21140 [Rufibacter latericius]
MVFSKKESTMYLRPLLLLLFILFFRNAANAQYWKLAEEALDAIEQAQESNDDLQKLIGAAKDIEEGRTPNNFSEDWLKVTQNFDKAAKLIKSAPLPTDFDKSKYFINITGVNCNTQNQLLVQGNKYLADLKEARKSSIFLQKKLDKTLKLLDASSKAIKVLQDFNSRLFGLPEFGRYFQWNWLELETTVIPALSNLKIETNRHKNKLKAEYEKVTIQAENLESNLLQIRNLNCTVKLSSQAANSSEVQYGHASICRYKAQFSNIILTVDYNKGIRQIVNAVLIADFKESLLTSCSTPSIPINRHSYRGETASGEGGRINIVFRSSANNQPKCRVSFSGTFQGNVINGNLTFVRNDAGDIYAFTIIQPISININ